MNNNETKASGLVRIGTVTDVDRGKHMCRVYYPDREYTSGWLKVLINAVSTSVWMPTIGDSVVVLYLPVENADGFVLGGI